MTIRKVTGVLLVNVGTPDSPAVKDVKRYLKEFLSDPRVIDIPAWVRFMLLHFIILPFRSPKSAEAYKSIWLSEGSPLMVHSKSLKEEVKKILGSQFQIEICMRYQNPSIQSAIEKLVAQGVEKIIVFPLFPQYSSAATGTVFEKVGKIVNSFWNVPQLIYVPAFYQREEFINSIAYIAKEKINEFQPDFVLFSYHGLPERHVKKSDKSKEKSCLNHKHCCDKMNTHNSYCYRAQCYATTTAIATRLGLLKDKYATSFQSRLGRTPWIQPYTDEILHSLAQQGVKKIAVMCPAFVADCLETIEEIGMRLREQWISIGGEELLLVPSLNSHPIWAKAVANMILEFN
ncbi:ferrochelatase [Spirobacillus cienkowskii]|uniref:Ferrochelatase n=1 Tax=Spirobacillus cienkowskii TaxID=495820 RepID=A0A369KPA8_9BACT|nr:MAG: ferrochelatase [Spirobacillus cienkowskii]